MEASRRRFTIADGMILLAATAVGLALARAVADWSLERLSNPTFPASIRRVFLLQAWTIGMDYLTLTWGLTLPILRLRPPRPGRRRLLREPGLIACGAAAFAAAFGIAMRLPTLLLPMAGFRTDPRQWVVSLLSTGSIGLAVAAAWSLQFLSGRWRPVPNWIDRSGRALGLFWIVAALIYPWAMILLG
jgi:hypothetical protein